MFSHLLVATDGSEPSARALRTAATLAQRLSAQLTICYVCMPYSALVLPASPQSASVVLDQDSFRRQSSQRRQQVLGPAVAMAAELGVMAQTLSREHLQPWSGILEAADAVAADLIVMSPLDPRESSAPNFGSAVPKVLAYTHKPVLVVR